MAIVAAPLNGALIEKTGLHEHRLTDRSGRCKLSEASAQKKAVERDPDRNVSEALIRIKREVPSLQDGYIAGDVIGSAENDQFL